MGLNSLYDPPSIAPCQSVSSSSFMTDDCRSAYLVLALIAAAYLRYFATCSSTASGGPLTSCPDYILLNPPPIVSTKSAALSPLCSPPCHVQDVPSLSWHVAFSLHSCSSILPDKCVWGPSPNRALLRKLLVISHFAAIILSVDDKSLISRLDDTSGKTYKGRAL